MKIWQATYRLMETLMHNTYRQGTACAYNFIIMRYYCQCFLKCKRYIYPRICKKYVNNGSTTNKFRTISQKVSERFDQWNLRGNGNCFA